MNNATFKHIVIDTEANDLLEGVTTLHCLVIQDLETGEVLSFANQAGYAPIEAGIAQLEQAELIYGHNIVTYDYPVLRKLYDHIKLPECRDTLILSRLAYPDIIRIDYSTRAYNLPTHLRGNHSIEAWGLRFKYPKSKHSDFSQWSQDLHDRCIVDTAICRKIALSNKVKAIPSLVLELEHSFAHITFMMERTGFPFDLDKAQALEQELLLKKQVLKKDLTKLFPAWYEAGEVFQPKIDNLKKGYLKGVSFTKIKLVAFNPGSRGHIVKCLGKKYGWTPTVLTKNGNPHIDDEVLETIPYPEARELQEYFVIDKRLQQLSSGNEAWLKHTGSDNRIHGSVTTCGAVSRRCSHSHPNMAQVPSTDKAYGEECRELFTTIPGYTLVGIDLKSIEMRCLAHYLWAWDNGAYAKVVLTGDPHEFNRQAMKLATRGQAKTAYYALIYGGGEDRLGDITGKGKADGRRIKTAFYTSVPAFKNLKDSINTKIINKGGLKSIDGYTLPIRSSHSALNQLLQSCAAIIMKWFTVIFVALAMEKGYKWEDDFALVAHVHDEIQMLIKQGLEDTIIDIAKDAAKQAGEFLKFRLPVDIDSKVGSTWVDTH